MTYGYIRVSTDRQDTDNQKLGIVSKADQLQLSIDEWISDDGVSGSKEPEKRKLGKLLEKINSEDVVICSELSRLGRKLFMIMRILEHCMQVGAKVYTVKDGYELGDNIQCKVLAFAFGLAAEIERDMISKRTKEGLAKRRLDGVILGRPVGRKGLSRIDGKDAVIEKYLKGGLSIIEISRILKVSRSRLADFIQEKGIDYNKPPVPTHLVAHTFNNTKRAKIATHRDELVNLIKQGYAVKAMRGMLESNGVSVSEAAIRSYLKATGLYSLLEATNKSLRVERNKNCGLYKNQINHGEN